MSDLPIVAWIIEGGRIYQDSATTREAVADRDIARRNDGSVKAPLVRHAAATASLSSAQQRIEELERALDELVAPSQLYEAIAAEFSDDGVPWSRVRGDLRSVYRGYAKIINAWNRHVARAIGTREGGDANSAPGRSPESAVATATRPSEAYLSGISPQSAWPFAQDESSSKSSEP